ncbi:unnamed protein product [Lymnaea stagnalis]|uniref:Uncharacterized protein n=1 Tax=Lymnaea stagnalis TaxID=6523 RepID=A0AAV2H9H1_LYMST
MALSLNLSPSTVLVTGASRGLGLEFVKQFLKLPVPPKILIAGCRNPNTAESLKNIANANPSVKVIKLDVQKDEDIERASQETKSIVGDLGLNLLINNAGILDRDTGSLIATTRESLQKHFDVNVTSPIIVVQKFLPLLNQASALIKSNELSASKACIVMISAALGSQKLIADGTFAHANWTPYNCSKTALNMATIMISREVRDSGILVIGLHPGWVRTDMGTDEAPIGPEESIADCLKVISEAREESNGRQLDLKGKVLPF